MGDRALLGVGRHLVPIPGFVWRPLVDKTAKSIRRMMSDVRYEAKRVRDVALEEIVRTAGPVAPSRIAEELELSAEAVEELLEDAEKRKVFLFRDGTDDVQWAYPVTAAATPHRLRFSTGETLNAA